MSPEGNEMDLFKYPINKKKSFPDKVAEYNIVIYPGKKTYSHPKIMTNTSKTPTLACILTLETQFHEIELYHSQSQNRIIPRAPIMDYSEAFCTDND